MAEGVASSGEARTEAEAVDPADVAPNAVPLRHAPALATSPPKRKRPVLRSSDLHTGPIRPKANLMSLSQMSLGCYQKARCDDSASRCPS